ncbi:MAG TPA: AMP-binding protein, partial [Pyrinomonadaceae bacterium]|nr:AMP-binding protein [Pyrinomonadaceae bacterium]
MHDVNLLEDQPIAWTPTPEVIERAQITKFMQQVGVSTWEELYEFSIRDVEKFTQEVLEFLDIRFDPPYSRLLNMSNGFEFPEWFNSPPRRGDAEDVRPETGDGRQESEPGAIATGSYAGLNITTMCLDRWQTDEMKDQPALIWEAEDGGSVQYTYEELKEEVEAVAAGLRLSGLGKSDAIGIHLPMIPETVVALLAINRIGAIAVPVFSGYGVEAIASRMNAVGAKALFTCDGFPRRGKFFDALAIAADAVATCSTMRHVFVIGAKNSVISYQLSVVSYSEYHDLVDKVLDEDADQLGGTHFAPEPTSA